LQHHEEIVEPPEGLSAAGQDHLVTGSSILEQGEGSVYPQVHASDRKLIHSNTPEINSDDSTLHKPTASDICLGKNDHPGTQEFHRVVNETLAELDSEEDYCPKIHKTIRMKLRGRRFFKASGNPPEKGWHLANKFEVRDEIGMAYDTCRGRKSPFFEKKP